MKTKYPNKSKCKVIKIGGTPTVSKSTMSALKKQQYEIEELKTASIKSGIKENTFEKNSEIYQDAYDTAKTVESEQLMYARSIARNTIRITALEEKTANIDSLENYQQTLTSVSAQVDQNTTNLENLSSQFSSHSQAFEELSSTVDQNTTAIQSTNNQLQNLSQTVSQNTSDIASLSTQVDQNTTNLENLTSQLSSHSQAFEELSSTVDQNTLNIEELSSTVEQNTLSIEELSSTVEQNTLSIEELKSSASNGSTGAETSNCTCAQEIETLQNDVANLQKQINSLTSPYDPYYTGKTPTDFEEGTIVQTYDEFSQSFNLETKSSVSLPTIYFSAEPESVATIKVCINFQLLLKAVNTLITIKCNNTTIYEDTFAVDNIDTPYSFSKELFDVSLNSTGRNNKLSITMTLEGSSSNTRTLNVTNLTADIIAPNAVVINKECPFDVLEVDGTYYLTDCTGEYVKTAKIATTEMNNMENLQWEQTDMQGISCKTIFNFQNYDKLYLVNNFGYLLKKPNYYYSFIIDDETNDSTASYISADWYPSTSTSTVAYAISTSGIRSVIKYTDIETLNISSGESGDFAKVTGNRYLKQYNNITSMQPLGALVVIGQDGSAYLKAKQATSAVKQFVGYGSDATLYLKQYTSSTNYIVDVYLKQYDKIVMSEYQYTGSAYNLLSTTEIGSYDKFFKMSNGDYFVVKNKQLMFFRDNTTE